MKPINIISAHNSSVLKIKNRELREGFDLSGHESKTLSKLIDLLKDQGAHSGCFDGYYVGYSIKQIGKEFDLLRFSEDLVINIELKAPLNEGVKEKKISRQMNQNYYYLKFLGKEILIYTYIEDDGLYILNCQNGQVEKVDASQLVEALMNQKVDYKIDPDHLFIPRHYLVSVFNDTERFLSGEYFLTNHQQNIKKEILSCINKRDYKMYCIQASAGTGKTLLGYDIARYMIEHNYSPLVIHCGKLNHGHLKLIELGWEIYSAKDIDKGFICRWNNSNIDIVIVDEAQRISRIQLDLIIDKSINLKLPIIFMYDFNQYLIAGGSKDIYDYIQKSKKDIPVIKRRLTNKIRTNKEMASFIENLIHIGSSKSYLNYENITIEYFSELEDIVEYIGNLEKHHDWKTIAYTPSSNNLESSAKMGNICETRVHDVIGQEFSKVVLIMDSSFKYNKDGRLEVKEAYSDAIGMLYQIVTRVVEELKIIVHDNPDLFIKLLGIKHFTIKELEAPYSNKV